MPDTPDVAAIRARAEAATPGPWEALNGGDRVRSVVRRADERKVVVGYAEEYDAAHITGLDPATVIALCDHIDALTQRAERDEKSAQEAWRQKLASDNKWDEARATIDRVQALADKWENDDLPTYPANGLNAEAKFAAALLRLCIEELRRALAGDQEDGS